MLRPFSSETYRRNAKKCGGDECCLCGKPTAGQDGAIHVPVNHCTGEFVTDAEITAMGEERANNDVSLFPIGPECAKKWAKGYPETTRNRFRRQRGKLISYDHRIS